MTSSCLENRYGRFRPSRVQIPAPPLMEPFSAQPCGLARHRAGPATRLRPTTTSINRQDLSASRCALEARTRRASRRSAPRHPQRQHPDTRLGRTSSNPGRPPGRERGTQGAQPAEPEQQTPRHAAGSGSNATHALLTAKSDFRPPGVDGVEDRAVGHPGRRGTVLYGHACPRGCPPSRGRTVRGIPFEGF
jgi:hypothetical protein